MKCQKKCSDCYERHQRKEKERNTGISSSNLPWCVAGEIDEWNMVFIINENVIRAVLTPKKMSSAQRKIVLNLNFIEVLRTSRTMAIDDDGLLRKRLSADKLYNVPCSGR